MPYADVEGLAAWVAGFGADVVVLDPPELRDAVVRRFEGVLAGHGGNGHLGNGPVVGGA